MSWRVTDIVDRLCNKLRLHNSQLKTNLEKKSLLYNDACQHRPTMKQSGYLSEAVYNKIRPRHRHPPGIYGLSKIHKADVPLRLIVSCVNTFTYYLSAYLANILSPLTGKSEYTVTNSAHFVSTVSNETIQDNEIMVSFDTNVPIDVAVQAAL